MWRRQQRRRQHAGWWHIEIEEALCRSSDPRQREALANVLRCDDEARTRRRARPRLDWIFRVVMSDAAAAHAAFRRARAEAASFIPNPAGYTFTWMDEGYRRDSMEARLLFRR